MNALKPPVIIDYFSDVLCVWAYISQIRVDELKQNFGERVVFRYHFIPVFGCTAQRIGEPWKHKGGSAGYSAHVADIGKQFPHVELHSEVWTRDIPASSAAAHYFLKAVQLSEANGEFSHGTVVNEHHGSVLERMAWLVRCAFFRDLLDVSRLEHLVALAENINLPVNRIEAYMNDGTAMAAMCRDVELCKQFKVDGSPTYILNEGRQKLYGNLGYKILAANVQEIMNQPGEAASWC